MGVEGRGRGVRGGGVYGLYHRDRVRLERASRVFQLCMGHRYKIVLSSLRVSNTMDLLARSMKSIFVLD